jgi:hypothetical protein
MPEHATIERIERVGPERTRRQFLRWVVHLGLMVTLVVSLVFEYVLTIHIVVGFAFVVLVGAHLVQRRRTSIGLVRRLGKLGQLHRRPGRLALSDSLLTLLTAAMLLSGVWDWIGGHPTKIRWHAVTGIALTVYLVVHTLRRRKRLRGSRVT